MIKILHKTFIFIVILKRILFNAVNYCLIYYQLSVLKIDIYNFNFSDFRIRILGFLNAHRLNDTSLSYFYSQRAAKTTLYASVYSFLTQSMIGGGNNLDENSRGKWKNYFDSFQNEIDGLFYDENIDNNLYKDSDWWGARHLALHIVTAYSHLNCVPKFKFNFLIKYYDQNYIKAWLDSYDWNTYELCNGDLDNKIMNVTCLLQFQRDAWNDTMSGSSVEYIKEYLISKINKSTGVWGNFDFQNKSQRSRIIQFAYHLFPIFFYDNYFDFDIKKIVRLTLKTQNKFGGYGVSFNSSACEDMDSLFILIKFYNYVDYNLRGEINQSLLKAFNWILLNQVKDGGFVFKRGEQFVYGHLNTSSWSDQGALMPTWFRTLSLIYLFDHFNINYDYNKISSPGYEFY